MRWHGDWMQGLDERVLERLAEQGNAPARMIASDIDEPRLRVARLCKVLAEAEFIEREEREGFADERYITSWGLLYLAGELNAELRRPEPGMRPGGRIRPGWYTGFS
ncbi:repressor phrH2 [Halobaculum roseum]|uniref:Repressor phrH2 n=1 Tax=Halobaculum roseum TaxID=2175149 RepID=A0ABD5MTX7_9EURY|nr:repressor phrH2 [Halobaculum roseum]QZY03936.1 repressor phrH2 [Halobaculum roseum]